MLAPVLALWAALLGTEPVPCCSPNLQKPAVDTTRVVQGRGNMFYAWGKILLLNGECLQGYLPIRDTGIDMVVMCYPSPPDSKPAPKPKALLPRQVQWMRVQGQYSELMDTYLAARRVGGPVELFLVRATSSPLISFLGPQPAIIGVPATSRAVPLPEKWYLRRANGTAVLVNPKQFASQLADFFADYPELAKHVAASEEGYGLAELEALVRQYNQHVRR